MKYYSHSQCFPIYLSLLIFLIASCSEAQQVPFSFKLPNKLKEVSGLAYSPDGRVFALNDEKGIVYEIDMKDGGIVPITKLRKANGKTLRADFEGLAFLNDEFHLVTSKGMLYRSTLLENKLQEQAVDTGLSEICEVEGLSAYDDILYLVCKTNYREKDKGFLLIYEHNPKSRKTELYLRVATERLNRRKLNPSGIAVTENEIFVVSAIQGILTRLDKKGNFIRDLELDTKRHRQTEGILVLDSGTIILADEGKRKHGRVTVYEAR